MDTIDLLIQERRFLTLEPLVHAIPEVSNYVNKEDKLAILSQNNSTITDFYSAYYLWIRKEVKKSTPEDVSVLTSFIRHPHAMSIYIKMVSKSLTEYSEEDNKLVNEKVLVRMNPECFLEMSAFFSYKPAGRNLKRLFGLINSTDKDKIAKVFIDAGKVDLLQEMCSYNVRFMVSKYLSKDSDISDMNVLRILDSIPSHLLEQYKSDKNIDHPMVSSYVREKRQITKKEFKVMKKSYYVRHYLHYIISEDIRLLISIDSANMRHAPPPNRLLDEIAASPNAEYLLGLYINIYLKSRMAKEENIRVIYHPIAGLIYAKVVENSEHLKILIGTFFPEYTSRYGSDTAYLKLYQNQHVDVGELDLNRTYPRSSTAKMLIEEHPELNIKTFKIVELREIIHAAVGKMVA